MKSLRPVGSGSGSGFGVDVDSVFLVPLSRFLRKCIRQSEHACHSFDTSHFSRPWKERTSFVDSQRSHIVISFSINPNSQQSRRTEDRPTYSAGNKLGRCTGSRVVGRSHEPTECRLVKTTDSGSNLNPNGVGNRCKRIRQQRVGHSLGVDGHTVLDRP